MAYELITRFVAEDATTEEEAREAYALWLANTPGNEIADEALTISDWDRYLGLDLSDPMLSST
jgi:hypothetical protein